MEWHSDEEDQPGKRRRLRWAHGSEMQQHLHIDLAAPLIVGTLPAVMVVLPPSRMSKRLRRSSTSPDRSLPLQTPTPRFPVSPRDLLLGQICCVFVRTAW